MKKQNRGVAIVIVLVALTFVSILSVELFHSSRVDLVISSNAKDRLQAYYLAKSGAKVSLLRIKIYKELENLMSGGQELSGVIKSLVPPELKNQIWSAPLPEYPLPGQKVSFPGKLLMSISSEGSKIPINLLDGDPHREGSEEMQKEITTQIKEIWEGLLDDEDFYDRYRDIEIEELVNNLRDWIDRDDNKVEGGSEERDYARLEYKPRNNRIPTLTELNMVKGWNDDIIEKLGREFSVINNSKKLNPNYISLTRLKAWHPELSLEDLSAIQQRRLTEPFSSLNDLKTFIQNSELIRNGRDFEFPREYESSIQELTFVIESTGIVGQARRSLKLGVRLDPERVKEDQNGGPNPNDGENDGDGDPNDDENDNDGGNENSEAENSKFLDPYVVSIEESWT